MTTLGTAALGGVALDGARTPIDRVGTTVLRELVEEIVSGRAQPGDTLPPEAALSLSFGVSRTVIRESMKRLQEKGMVTVAQGRGTQVNAMAEWNILDPLVLSTLIVHDDSLGILDDLSVVRGALESVMAGGAAAAHTDAELARLRDALEQMRASVDDSPAFRQADVAFHLAVMEMSGNQLAENIAKILFRRALESTRYHGVDPEHAFELTLAEHERVFAAIERGDVEASQRCMNEHIVTSWERRRLPTQRARR
jgi:GntR family transcriptional regulator, galactonate operon transcriptional repressor